MSAISDVKKTLEYKDEVIDQLTKECDELKEEVNNYKRVIKSALVDEDCGCSALGFRKLAKLLDASKLPPNKCEQCVKSEALVNEMEGRIDRAGTQLGEMTIKYAREFSRADKTEADSDRLREELENLCCEAGDLSSHEIDGGAPDNRWEDMRVALLSAEQALIDTEGKEG
jgi:predicted ThiF/HesA family dinucleotide-utilizing enzyme